MYLSFKLMMKTLTLVGVHSLQIHHMPHNVVLVTDAVATQHVPAAACNVQRLAAGVTLQEADHLWGGPVQEIQRGIRFYAAFSGTLSNVNCLC